MEQLQSACRTIQYGRSDCMINPTASDLSFDFSFTQESICFNCQHRSSCKISDLLNVPVESCRFYVEEYLSVAN